MIRCVMRMKHILTGRIGGPFMEIVEEVDIFINCTYLSAKIPPFINEKTLSSPHRTLSVVCNVSADTYV